MTLPDLLLQLRRHLRPQTSADSVWIEISKWAFILALLVVGLQALHPAWRFHALVDSYFVYYDRAHYFFEHGNLTHLTFNEYQPGAIFYFVSLAPIFWWSSSRDAYTNSVIISNLLMLAGYGWLLRRWLGPISTVLLAVVILFTGPISLLRFEVFCHLWVVAAIWCWWRRQPWWTGIFLGIAIMTKVYPLFWLPLLAWWQPVGKPVLKRWPHVFKVSLGTGLGMVGVLAAYLLVFGVNLEQVTSQLLVHAGKPVHFESVIGAVTMLKTSWLEQRAPLPLGNLIHGIAASEYGAWFKVINYLWVPGLAWLYWAARRPATVTLQYLVSYLVLLMAVFLTFSSQLGPQYLLWFGLLVPLEAWPRAGATQRLLGRACGWLLLTLALTQFVFPLWYTELLTYFDTSSVTVPVLVLWLRSLSLIIFSWQWWRWQQQLTATKEQ